MKNNLIDFVERRKQQREKESNKPKKIADEIKADFEAPVDITEMRQDMINDERREVRRTILTGFIGAFVVVPNQGLLKVDIYDISEDGIAFDMDWEEGQFDVGEEVAMRVYMNQHTYFPFIITIKNTRLLASQEASRHGASFVKGTVNDEALYHFVKFIETVSASLERDSGDVMVSNLKK